MKWMGTEVTLVEVMGIYAYSFSSFLVTGIFCAIPINLLQWALISYSLVTSVGFLWVTYWKEFSRYMGKAKILAILGICSA
jgi:hypothetical protein